MYEYFEPLVQLVPLWIIIGCLGLFWGSFLNVVILRLQSKQKGMFMGKSECPACKHPLAWYDLFPLFSWIFLRGKCRYCKNPISAQYPLVEFFTAIVFGFIVYNIDQTQDLLHWKGIFLLIYTLYVMSNLIVLFVYDFKYYLLPDAIILPLILVVATVTLILGTFNMPMLQAFWHILIYLGVLSISFVILYSCDYAKNLTHKILLYSAHLLPFVGAELMMPGFLQDSLLGFSLSLFFAIQFYLSDGKVMGGGDITFGAFMGLFLGWKLGILAIFISYCIGAIVGIGILATRDREDSMIALGPYLCLGTCIALFYGQDILHWYQKFL